MSELTFLSATELAAKLAAREVSATELLNHYLQRVDQYNDKINAVVVDTREQALADADALDQQAANGEFAGPLHGIPMTVKESYNITGKPTTWGNTEWRENIATEDAEAVKRLKREGATVFGKTNVPLALADFQSYNDVYGTTGNPYDPNRTPGGSSGGSAAALAAGLSALEIGSDIGGSIRNPAHFCGVFGHKPTWNLLWMRGHSGPGDVRASSDISVIGPLARGAEDLYTATKILAGPDEIAARGMRLDLPELDSRGVKGLRVGIWPDDDMCRVSREVLKRVENVAQALTDEGADVHLDAKPDFASEHSHDTYQRLLQATMASRMPDEQYKSLQAYTNELDEDDQSTKAKTFRAQTSTFRDWSDANELRHQLRWRWHEYFQNYDVLVTPIMPTAAFPHDHAPFGDRTLTVDNEERPYFEQVFWAGLTGVAYLPSTVIPTGLNDDGLPIGVQIVGPEYADLITIGVSQVLERAGFKFTPPPAFV